MSTSEFDPGAACSAITSRAHRMAVMNHGRIAQVATPTQIYEQPASTYVADFVCYESIIIELKAVRTIAPEHRAQTINYLRASGMKLGLLVNFGASSGVEIERFALERAASSSAFSAHSAVQPS